MSIATSLQKVLDSKEAIKTSINNKGGQITSATPFSAYSAAIDNLPSGGGGGDKVLDSVPLSAFSAVDSTTAVSLAQSYVTVVNIPNTVEFIRPNAFMDCKNLRRFNSNIDGVADFRGIGVANYAFANCKQLEQIYIDSNPGMYAFSGCSSLRSIDMSSGITSFSEATFRDCRSLEEINIPSGLTRIGSDCFLNCSGLTSITEDLSNITSIGANAFSGCTSLSGAINLNGVTSLSQCVFGGTKLSAITVDNVQYISYQVFYTTLIETLNLPSIKSCGSAYFGAFQYMGELTGITFGSSLTSIQGPYTFRGCTKLLSVTFESTTPPSVPTLFEKPSANLVIYVPSESVEAYKATTGFVEYADRIQAIPTA